MTGVVVNAPRESAGQRASLGAGGLSGIGSLSGIGGPGGPEGPGSVSKPLPSTPAAVREARAVVHRVLSAWSAEAIFDDVALVASELVANALRHGLAPALASGTAALSTAGSGAAAAGEAGGIRISLVSTGSHVICVVTDPSAEPPVRRAVDPLASSGRGLQLVESLSVCWGWTMMDDDEPARWPRRTGKSVWAIFSLTGHASRSAQVVGAA